jgi:hypothetical protein
MRIKKRVRKPVRARHSNRVKKLLQSARSMSSRTMIIAAVTAGGAALVLGAASSNVRADRAARPASNSTSTITPAPETAPAASLPSSTDSTRDTSKQFAAVTITGCLERDAETFRLKDTAGENAPKARSWKSAFLKKGSSSVEVTDAANRVKLPAHVGQRVSVTGTLVDREMQVRSLQRIAASCSVKS